MPPWFQAATLVLFILAIPPDPPPPGTSAPAAAPATAVRPAGRSTGAPKPLPSPAAAVATARRAIAAGETIGEVDLATGDLPPGLDPNLYARSPGDAAGRVAAARIAAGRPIPLKNLRAPCSVRRGEEVWVTTAAGGFVAAFRGKALESGALGTTIRVVNSSSGRVITGTVAGPAAVTIEASP